MHLETFLTALRRLNRKSAAALARRESYFFLGELCSEYEDLMDSDSQPWPLKSIEECGGAPFQYGRWKSVQFQKLYDEHCAVWCQSELMVKALEAEIKFQIKWEDV